MPQRTQREPSGVAEQIEHPLPLAVFGDRAAIMPLVEVKPRLLSCLQIDQYVSPSSTISSGASGSVPTRASSWMCKPSCSAIPPLGPRQYAVGPGLFEQETGQHLAALVQGQARELDDQPAVVTVDRQPRDAVPLARDDAVRPSRTIAAAE